MNLSEPYIRRPIMTTFVTIDLVAHRVTSYLLQIPIWSSQLVAHCIIADFNPN